jgi:hypothetical protein
MLRSANYTADPRITDTEYSNIANYLTQSYGDHRNGHDIPNKRSDYDSSDGNANDTSD